MELADPSGLPVVSTYYEALNRPNQWTVELDTWESFATRLASYGHRRDMTKHAAPLVSLVRLRDGGHRCREDVVSVHGMCLDFDDCPLEQVVDAAARFKQDGISFLWYTTWSHGQPTAKHFAGWRLIVPLAAPMDPRAYDRALEWVWARYAHFADREARGVERAFFVPSCHPAREHLAQLFYQPGVGLTIPPEVLAGQPIERPPLAPVPDRPVCEVDESVFRMLAARWKRSTSPAHLDLATRLQKVLEGIPFASAGERDTILWRLLSAIVHAYPDVSADSISQLFQLSLDRMAQIEPADHFTDADVREKLERARVGVLASRNADMPSERVEAIRQAFGTDRTAPYSLEECEAIRQSLNVPPDAMPHAWILQHETDYYFVGPNAELVHCSREAFPNVARVVLAPAPVNLHVVDKSGIRSLTRTELLEKYSTPLRSVARSLVESKPRIDLVRRALTLPACRKRSLAPTFDPQIDEWLKALAGVNYTRLLAWLSFVPDLSRPLTGLVLTGPKSVGKSMLARGLSRLWTTTGPSTLIDALGGFNATLERCPFVHADESEIPTDFSGNERTGALRELIQSTSRQVNEKYRRAVTLEGAIRLQISANNEDVLALNAHLTKQDVDAVAERFTHIRCSADAAVYLADLGGWDACEPWIEGDSLPKHVLWLYEHLGSRWEGRFGVPPAPSLVSKLTVAGGVRAHLCELFVRVLRDSAPLDEGATVLAGRLVVHLDWILTNWQRVLNRIRQPSTSAIIKALDGLGERVGSEISYTAIDTDLLVAWAESSGYGNRVRVEAWLANH